MPSFVFDIGEKEAAVARFLSMVHAEIQKAFSVEKGRRKLTQQRIAEKLGVNRSVVNRQVMGYENLTAKSIAELAWSIGYEPKISLVSLSEEREANFHSNIDVAIDQVEPAASTSTKSVARAELKVA